MDRRGALLFRRGLDVPTAQVRAAVTTPAGLRAWFPSRLDGNLATAGADLQSVFPAEDPGGADTAHGTVLAVAPGRRLVFTGETEELRLGFEPLGEGRCVLDFDHLLPADDESTAARTAAGRHTCLEALEQYRATGAVAPPRPIRPRFGAMDDPCVTVGFPSGAPLAGDDGV